jgi:hypothetical protein
VRRKSPLLTFHIPHLNPPLFGLAPGGVCRATPVTWGTGELLPRLFTLTPQSIVGGGFLSVALSFGSPRVAVSDHPALWSSDFPPLLESEERSPRLLQPLRLFTINGLIGQAIGLSIILPVD